MKFYRQTNRTMKAKAALLSSLSASALAMSGFAAPAAAQGGDAANDTIIVTAQRREESLQDVPISISALSGDNLYDRGVTNLKGVSNFAPNVEFTNTNRPTAGGAAYGGWIRGVGTGDYAYPTDPGIGLYVDGVYMARTLGGLLSIADIERVEILRGPQGTLYGRNTIGGAINVVTTEAKTSGEAEGMILGRLGNYGRADVVTQINTPLIEDRLGFKASVGYFSSDGHGESLYDGQQLNDEERLIMRAGFLLEATPELTFDLRGDYSRQDNHGPVAQYKVDNGGSGFTDRFNDIAAPVQNAEYGLAPGTEYGPAFALPGTYQTWAASPLRDDFIVAGGSLTATYSPSDAFTLKSITAYRDLSTRVQVDGDNSPYRISSTDERISDQQFSQELQASGELSGGRVNYVAGLFYFNETGESEKFSEFLNGVYEVTGLASDARDSFTYQDYKATSYAAFTQFDVGVTDALTLVLGARVNHDKKDFTVEVTLPQLDDAVRTPLQTQSSSWTSFTPRVGVNWKVSPETLLYTSYATGFKSGGFGNPTATMAAPIYDPEKLRTFEAGVKTEAMDGLVTANLAAFLSKWDDIQLNVIVPGPTGGFVNLTDNAGTARLYGFEFDTVIRPADGLRFNLGVGYTHNEFTDLDDGVVGVTLDTKLPHVPKWSVTPGFEYSWNTGFGQFMVRSDLSYRSDQFLTIADTGSLQEGYALVSARASFTPASLPNLEIGIEGTNLTDEYYLVYEQAVGLGMRLSQPGDPRTIAATARVRF